MTDKPYEVKFDGHRWLAGKDASGVTRHFMSRRGNLFTEEFPTIARACKRLPTHTLVDGEIMAVDESDEPFSTFSSTTDQEPTLCSFMFSMC
jgi:ATP-dependent DNA ligase